MTDFERELSDMMHRHAEGLNQKPLATRKLVWRAWRRRAATATVAGVAVVGLALGGITLIPRLASHVAPAHHSQRDTGGPTLLAPLCGDVNGGQPACPTTTPAGDYRSALRSLGTEWPFRFTLPSGWKVNALPEGRGLDLIDSKRVGASLLVFPHAADGNPANDSGPQTLADSVTRRPSLDASVPTQTTFAGMPAWAVDVRVREGAPTTFHCRIGEPGSREWKPWQPSARCVPLFRDRQSLYGQAAVAPLDGKAARLIFFTGPRRVTAVLWVWNLGRFGGDLGGSPVQRVLESFRFERQHKSSP